MEQQESNGTAFQFFDGEKTVYGDAIRIQYEIYACVADPDATLKDADDENFAVSVPARWKLVEAARLAFPMVPFDPQTGKGATVEHCEKALDDLWAYLAKKKPSTDGSATLSEPTTSTPTSLPPMSASA